MGSAKLNYGIVQKPGSRALERATVLLAALLVAAAIYLRLGHEAGRDDPLYQFILLSFFHFGWIIAVAGIAFAIVGVVRGDVSRWFLAGAVVVIVVSFLVGSFLPLYR